jgi:hypothetical protein
MSHEQLSTNLLDSLDDHNYRDKGQDDTAQTKMRSLDKFLALSWLICSSQRKAQLGSSIMNLFSE